MYCTPIKILLVEDNIADADLLQEILAAADTTQWSLVHVQLFQEAISTLSAAPFDVILLDLSLPDKQGLSTVAQTHETVPDLPIVVLTGLNDKVTAMEALRQGAQDYLIKGKIDTELLIRAIFHAIERAQTQKKLRQSEEQLQRLNEELEHRVAEQVEELKQKNQYLQREIAQRQHLEEELRNALIKEKELSELKSNIISVVSHEYRTPLTTILSSAELLEHYSQKWPIDKKKRHFQRIQNTVHHMTQLISDVLLINKAEVGKLEFKPSPLDLVVFCRELVEELQLTINSQHYINFNSQAGCCSVYMDEKLLRQFLTNLLSNAIKYSPDGGNIQFDLLLSKDAVSFRIQDEGIGIPTKDQVKLFDAFYRSSNVGTISGTGLGLTIVKKCVELHKGTVTVESEVEVGTTFTVTIPVPQDRPDSIVYNKLS
ncbi:MAG TPA: hybrid sensor histidine kinase/response regulator [Cyanobacteria bacterium UBA8803]|nr:hybrid sensor histidine kinase/response regulator [Cyanobacteria bacterium UBA9273]HBL60285.1 hybrid sensor histidine kinase/response regulator [Cyanobacteria bacterium UBA8803]